MLTYAKIFAGRKGRLEVDTEHGRKFLLGGRNVSPTVGHTVLVQYSHPGSFARAVEPRDIEALYKIRDAFADLVDGLDADDIENLTGLPRKRCEEIAAIRSTD
jgi:hypothetical protein